MRNLGIATITILPSLLLWWHIYKKRTEHCTTMFIIIAFLLECMVIFRILECPYLLPDNPFKNGTWLYHFYQTLDKALLEEFWAKFIVLHVIITIGCSNTISKYNIIVIIVTIASTFSLIENMLYVFDEDYQGNRLILAIVRIFCAVGHCSYAQVMGWFYGKARQEVARINRRRAVLYLACSIVIPTLMHTTANLLTKVFKLGIMGMAIWAGYKTLCLLLGLRLAKLALKEIEMC